MRRLCLVLLLAAGLGACAPRADAPAAKTPDMHNSRNSLDWAGSYEGVLPCADCPGIKTRLVLSPDGQFELSTQYMDRQPAGASAETAAAAALHSTPPAAASSSRSAKAGCCS
jgi:uncharacterized lipoprotein NlpE involved in copper resistance